VRLSESGDKISGLDVLMGAAGLLRVKEVVDVDALACVCGYDGAEAMCRPSLDPGGVSSPAETDALAEAEADCDVAIESSAEAVCVLRFENGFV
jgi:hypothetical protein